MLCLGLVGCASIDIKKERIATFNTNKIINEISSSLTSPWTKELLREEMINRHPEWPQGVQWKVRGGEIAIGMTEEQVKASWGKPNDYNRTVTKYGSREQWIYGVFPSCTYIYFNDGVLTSWQD